MFKIENRRYIGSKRKLINEITEVIDTDSNSFKSFFDVFGGTGVVTANMIDKFEQLYINDILYSNECIYNAFFGFEKINEDKISIFIQNQNNTTKFKKTFFSDLYANTYFDLETALKIGNIRENIKEGDFNKRERDVLITSLIYSADRCANTVGHYESFFKTNKNTRKFTYESIEINNTNKNKVKIYRSDANDLVKQISSDVVYIDPPYNSRQYSRFYHVLETLVKWVPFKPQGKALKPPLENLSGYSRNEASILFKDLIENTKAKLIVVSYNDTYNSSSNSSNNKIKYNELISILESKGNVTVKEISHNHFNAGKTLINNNKEYLFICEVCND